MACGSSSSTSLKIATLCIGLVFILHTVGFALPWWSSLTLSTTSDKNIDVDNSYHYGLWKECSCISGLGTEKCDCVSKEYIPEWIKGVRALETMALIGLLISLITSIVIVCRRQEKITRGINIACATVSGIFILSGAIIFGTENAEDLEEKSSYIGSFPVGYVHGTLASSFIFCTIAGCLCLLVCVPLLVYDYRKAITTDQPND